MKKTGKTKRMPMAQAAMPAMTLPLREPRLGPRALDFFRCAAVLLGAGASALVIRTPRTGYGTQQEGGDGDGEDHHDHTLCGSKTVVLRAVERFVNGEGQVRGAERARRS